MQLLQTKGKENLLEEVTCELSQLKEPTRQTPRAEHSWQRNSNYKVPQAGTSMPGTRNCRRPPRLECRNGGVEGQRMKRLPVSDEAGLRGLGKNSGFYSKWVEDSKQVVISSELGF